MVMSPEEGGHSLVFGPRGCMAVYTVWHVSQDILEILNQFMYRV